MLTEEEARRLVLAEIDDMRGDVEYDLQILRVEVLSFGWIFSSTGEQSGMARAAGALGWEAAVHSWWIANTGG